MEYICSSFKDAKEYGSILDIKNINFNSLFDLILNFESNKNNLNSFKYQNEIQTFKNSLNQAIILSQNYDVVITNPPYMGTSGMNANLKDYLKKNFPNSKSDLFAVFIEKCHDFSKSKGFVAMITQQSFMFLSTFEKLRVELINTHTIIDMAHLGAHAFEEIGGEVVQATSFINRNNFIENYNSTFHRLTEFNSESKKEQEFHNDRNNYYNKQLNFNKIPGNPIAYWVPNNIIEIFSKCDYLEEICELRQGLASGNNKKFLKYWFEVEYNEIFFNATSCENFLKNGKKFAPHNKGGFFRKWYGNQEYVIKFNEKSYNELLNSGNHLPSRKFYFKSSLSWSAISSGKVAFRYYPVGLTFDNSGRSIFIDETNKFYVFGLLNSNVCAEILSFLSPTLNYEVGQISMIPILFDKNYFDETNLLVSKCIEICQKDWDDYELSWNFKTHPFLAFNSSKNLENIFKLWNKNKINQFINLKNNEELLNKIYSKIYGINSEEVVPEKYVSVTKADINLDIISFVSYAVGCMFGRYSLDNEGLQFAGGEFHINNYHKFIPDDDNIIPVLDTAYFDDDIVGYFTKFVETCFGSEKLEENLDFIAGALSNSNKPSRDIIRDYLLKNFFNDHKKNYKKCPIYWQFSSGKENGFNCLVYMHRYEPSLVARIRTDYLHKTQKAIEQRIENNNNIINNSTSKQEVAKATKEKAKLQKQLKETQEYDEVLAHIANQNIEIDLDDGVKINYAKFQNIEIKKEGSKTRKVNLLKKI